MHILIEAGVLSRSQAVDAVQTAAEVKEELATENDEPRGSLRESLRLLHQIEHSFRSTDDAD